MNPIVVIGGLVVTAVGLMMPGKKKAETGPPAEKSTPIVQGGKVVNIKPEEENKVA
jgi:hypothetical protein